MTGARVTPAAPAAQRSPQLLSRLNERGFRLVMLADAFAVYGISAGAMIVRYRTTWPSYPLGLYLMSFAVTTVLFVGALYLGGLYEREPRLGAPPVLPRAMRQTFIAGGVVALLTLTLTGLARELGLTTARALPFPIGNLVALIPLSAIAVATNRWLVHWARVKREGPPRVLLVGSEEELRTARLHLEADRGRARIVGESSEPSQVVATVRELDVTDVVLLSRWWLDPLYPGAVETLERGGITVLLRVTARETMFGLERVREVGGMPFVLLRSQTVPRSRAHFKRLFDLTVLVPSAVVWLPVLLAVSAYQLVVAGRPLLYWQDRVGAFGRRFRMVKFRTMSVDAENDGRGARLAEVEDPRVIPACRWVRATRMDELPQLWNVIRGEMSLVGPRPERPELTEQFEQQIPGYARRHELPPGLTGLAQIHGRYHTDAEYKLGYDLHYLVNWSPVLDLLILARTLWVVVLRRL